MANKKDVIREIANVENVTLVEAEARFDSVISAIKTKFIEDKKLNIPDFLKLEIKERKERTGRNPQTGAEITIPARNKIKVKAVDSFEDLLN